MTEAPKVSIVIPFFNGGPFISGAFDQVDRQTFRDIEVIVVDDGSRLEDADRARNVCLQRGGRYIRQENGGPASARNTGVRHAKGDWIAFLDVDDHWAPTKLEKQYDLAAKGHELILCNCETVDQGGAVQVVHAYGRLGPAADFPARILKGEIYSFTSALFVSRHAFRSLGGFDERLRFWEDHLLLYRCVRELRCAYIAEALSQRVIHSGSISHPSHNLDVDALVERRRLFLDVITSLYSDVRKEPYLSQSFQSAAKMAVALGNRRKALQLSLSALRTQASVRALLFVGAVLATFLKHDLFRRWYPELRPRPRAL